MRVGLRFAKSQARVLEALAERAANHDVAEAHSLFVKAAVACRSGECLHVECTDVEEARKVAQGFSRYGVTPPTIEDIGGKLWIPT